MIKKVISGGQVGADVASLRAAKSVGIETGGFAPRDFKTIKGINLELAEVYGLVETKLSGYPIRTFANVKHSDGTMRLAFNFSTPGERCTMNAILTYNKPHLDIDLTFPTSKPRSAAMSEALTWLSWNNIETLNVAGNAKEEIEHTVEDFIKELLLIQIQRG